MVSLGDTAISLHILQPPLRGGGGVLESQNPKCQDLPKFQFPRGPGVLESQNPKCQDLPKFQFPRGPGVLESQNPKCQDLPKFQFSGGGGVLEPNSRTGVFWRILVKNFWKPSLLVHHR